MSGIPLDDMRADKQSGNRANTQEHSKRQEHLHVAFTLTQHEPDSDQGAGQHAEKNI
jgi:hypothetical protein